MKRILMALSLLPGITGYGQQQLPSLQSLSLPSAPGFMLVDLAPSLAEMPTTPRELTVGALHALDAQGGWPQNYAVETAPYWWRGTARSAYDVLGIRSDGTSRPFAGLRLASVSAAFVTRDLIPDGTAAQQRVASGGARARLLSFRSAAQKQRIDSGVRAWLAQAAQDLSDADPLLQAVPLTPADLQAIVDQKAARDRQPGSVAQRLSQTLSEKPVFTLDLAGAYGVYGIGDTAWKTGRYGAWLTAGLHVPLARPANAGAKPSYLSVLALGRYLYDAYAPGAGGPAPSGMLDAGGRLQAEIGRFSIGFEGVLRGYTRNEVGDRLTHRAVGTFSYQIRNGLCLNGAFGRNFDSPDRLISLFGLSFGFGDTPLVLPGDPSAGGTGSN